MNIETQAVFQSVGQEKTSAMSQGAEMLKRERETAQKEKVADLSDSKQEKNVQAEELLQNIKALTDNGAYSVRFEMYKETNDIVINLIEQDSGDVIRQIPPEEVLGIRESLQELKGNIVEIES